jgi:ferric-dicitrate binding protein FerR (iron transport regulator)
MKSKADQLVNAWIEGELSPEDEEALRALMTEDASVRESCYDLMLLDQMLAEREVVRVAHATESVLPFPKRKPVVSRTAMAAVASLAALVVAGLWLASRPDGKDLQQSSGPPITASSDSRITIAQREDRTQWSPGELLRLERGTAAIQLGKGVLAHLEGPAAVELANAEGDIRLLEGRGSFQIDPGGRTFTIKTPGGSVHGSGSQFVCEISPDQAAVVEVNSGGLEISSHSGRGPAKIAAGEAIRLEANGALTSTARPDIPFRAGLPEELRLYSDDFNVADGTLLSDHIPATGQKWEVLEQANPTVIRRKRLDTSAGPRQVLARLAPHDPGSTGSVYVFYFSLLPPTMSRDKLQKSGGIESITIVDPEGREIFSIVAEAINTHRWQLKGGGQVMPLTSVCALWEHQLTVCYGLNGRVTLHDGDSAQAPVIANLWLKNPAVVDGVRFTNRDGGDLAVRRIATSLLRAPSLRPE